MPCRDYYPDEYTIRQENRYLEQRNKLARIACRAMEALEKLGRLDLVSDAESNKWYEQHKKDDARAKKEAAREKVEKARKAKIKSEALAKLTPTERKELGL